MRAKPHGSRIKDFWFLPIGTISLPRPLGAYVFRYLAQAGASSSLKVLYHHDGIKLEPAASRCTSLRDEASDHIRAQTLYTHFRNRHFCIEIACSRYVVGLEALFLEPVSDEGGQKMPH